MNEKPLGQWDFKDLVSYGTWEIIKAITQGHALSGAVHQVLNLARQWQAENRVKADSEEIDRLRAELRTRHAHQHEAEALAEQLGPLPEARKPDDNGLGWFTAGQMHAYALQERAAERDRLALLAESRTDGWHSLTAAEIRRGAL